MNRFALSEHDQLVIKAGTNVVTRTVGGRLDKDLNAMSDIASQIGDIMDKTKARVTLVSSGAIAFAQIARSGKKPETVPEKQAAAARGQNPLQTAWATAFDSLETSREVSMHLLTADDMHGKKRENLLNAFAELDKDGVVKIVNENDTTATEEISFGDNDRLAAQVADTVGAKRVVLLSDVDGVYDGDPRVGHDSSIIRTIRVHELTNEYIRQVAGEKSSSNGTGGMRSKLEAARDAALKGAVVVIANGKNPDTLSQIVGGDEMVGTWVLPQ